MRTIIAGGRDYTLTFADHARLDLLRKTLPITEVVSGRARGADRGGEAWARSRGLPVKEFPADWDRYGNAAGPIRNGEMARYAAQDPAGGAVVLFPGGRGTNDMHEKAVLVRLKIIDWRHGYDESGPYGG